MGQCGQGNSTGPITKPKKVIGLDGVAIQQISAGTSHSLAWTALPRDRLAKPLKPLDKWNLPCCTSLYHVSIYFVYIELGSKMR